MSDSESKEIRITCQAADLLPIDSLVEFQGELKTISRDNLEKLKRSILRHGFSAPIFVWHGTDYHILDGHQRLKALIEFRQEGYNIPLLPVVYIEADNESHAKEKLLYITSQYGEFSQMGFSAFTEGMDFSFEDIRLTTENLELGVFEVGEVVAPGLADGDRAPYQQMTFTLHDEQARVVSEALAVAKAQGHAISQENENSNGNALAWIAEVFIDG